MLSKSKIKRIHAAVGGLFDRAKAVLLGRKLEIGKGIIISAPKEHTIPGLYEAAVRDEGGTPDQKTKDTLEAVLEGHLDTLRERAKTRVVKEVADVLQEAERSGTDTDLKTVLNGRLSEVWDSVASEVHRVVESESQAAKAFGLVEGIERINQQAGVDDPTMFFVVVRDGDLCSECRRLHLCKDGVRPKAWKLSECVSGYHKKGDPAPTLTGEHPHCRCSPATLLPGYGFTASGMVSYVAPGHDEWEHQRRLGL